MDGFQENDRILIVGATNLIQTLDPALTRPGRFDHKIEIKLPNFNDRKEIFRIHLSDKQANLSEEDIVKAAILTEGIAGAEI